MYTVTALSVPDGIAYARRWAFGRNPAYANFDAMGGDCTNFISQCLFAAGAIMNFTKDTGWYYRSLNDRAAAWTGVEFFYRFLTGNRSVGPFGHVAQLKQARPGDVIQLGNGGSFYHSLYVVGMDGDVPLVAAHSYNAFGKPLTAYRAAEVRCLRIDGCRRTAD